MDFLNLKLSLKRCAAFAGTAFCFAFIAVLVIPVASQAATVTPRLELSAAPGATLNETIKLYNEEPETRTFYLGFANFESQDETGNPSFNQRQEDLASWIAGPTTVTVGPGESKDVPIRISVPADADPGGHFGAIFFQSDPPNEGPGQVALSSKLGSLILLRVDGDFQQGATILEFGTKDKKRFFTAPPIDFYYRFQNTGDDHQKPIGDIIIKNAIGRLTTVLPANTVDGSVLPKSIRRFETTWQAESASDTPSGFWNNVKYQRQNFAFGKYTATLKTVFGTKQLQSANASFSFYIIPWQLLSVIIIGVIVVLVIGRFALKRYNSHIIAQARRRQ